MAAHSCLIAEYNTGYAQRIKHTRLKARVDEGIFHGFFLDFYVSYC
jgi:hypothetical protein